MYSEIKTGENAIFSSRHFSEFVTPVFVDASFGTEAALLILDFSLPKQPLLRFYRFYLHRILPKLAGWVTGTPEAYQYFGDSIEAFPKGETMLELMTRCGFIDCQATPLSCGIVTVYTGKKP